MNSIILTIWDAIRTLIVIGVIIFVHELGHFIAAKKLKIKVERFSIGFGPKMIGFVRGETEYAISWLPIFGGYVKMAGENPSDERKDEDEKGQFFASPISHRALIAFAGPATNIIFAVFAIAIAYMVGMPSRPGTEIGYVKQGSPAAKANIKPGDKVLSVAGYKVRKWEDISEGIAINPDKEIEVKLLRNGSENITIYVVPEKLEGTEIGKIGISPPMKPVISKVMPNSEAEKIGFRKDDVVQSVNDVQVAHVMDFVDEIERVKSLKNQVPVVINRSGQTENLILPLKLDSSGQVIFMDGIYFGKVVRLNPISAFGTATTETAQLGSKVFQFLKRLIMRDVPAKYVAGPVGILQITMSVVKTGIAGILWFAGFLSVNLGIVNLLPLFITDGGVLVFLLIEKMRGKPMTIKRQILVQQIGLGFIIMLFLVITYNDVLRLIRGTF